MINSVSRKIGREDGLKRGTLTHSSKERVVDRNIPLRTVLAVPGRTLHQVRVPEATGFELERTFCYSETEDEGVIHLTTTHTT